jgi:folate-binding protein YgfZ
VSLLHQSPADNPAPAPESHKSRAAHDCAAISAGVGIATLDHRLIVRITGDDRIPFMHGMCSNDIKGLGTGAVAPALMLTEHAHIIADFFVYAEADALLLEIDRALWPQARSHLEKFLVADEVEFDELDLVDVLDLEGPAAARTLAAVAGDVALALQPWRHAECHGQSGAARELRCANLPRCGGPAFTVLVERSHVGSLREELRAAAGTQLFAEVDVNALDLLRVEHGLARVGIDTTDKTIALEARLDSAISFSKGCYLGQETIERATARGGLKKRLFGLRIDGDRLPAAGSTIVLEGKEVGRLTSIVQSPRCGIIGLSILHHNAWPEGTRVTIADTGGEVPARVCELPFA